MRTAIVSVSSETYLWKLKRVRVLEVLTDIFEDSVEAFLLDGFDVNLFEHFSW